MSRRRRSYKSTPTHPRSPGSVVEVMPEDTRVLGVTSGDSAPPAISKSKDIDALKEPALVSFFNAMLQSAQSHRDPREPIWDQCWALYNNEYDWTGKQWWQHKAPVSKIRTSVDKAVALFRKTLLRMYPFYGVQSESRLGRAKGRYTMLLTDYWYDQAAVIEELVDSFKVGLITSSSILKIWWMRVRDFKPNVSTTSQEVPKEEFGVEVGSEIVTTRKVELQEFYKGKLGIKCVNPKNFWIVPGTNSRCVIERDEANLNEVEKLAKDGIYNKEAVKRLRESLVSQTISDENPHDSLGSQSNVSEGKPTANIYLQKVDLWHFWGDIYDTQGKLVMPDASFTLANKLILLRDARPNPFFHKDPPYVIGTPYKVPFSTYNRGMVEDVVEIAKAITNMANLIADGALYDAMRAFALNANQLDDPSEAKGGIYPGKVFIKNSDITQPGDKLIETIDVGKVPAEAMNMVGLFEKYYQEGTYMNEWVSGQGGKGDRTLGEVNIKTQSALEGLDESARNLETTVIEPVVDMSAKVIYQYHENFMLPRLIDNYPDICVLLQQLIPAERYAIMIGDFSFKVRGLSLMIDRMQRMGELKEILTLLSYIPGFIERLDADATLEEILMPMGWDVRRLLINSGTGAVTTPMTGVRPTNQGMPRNIQGPTPMQTRNAAEGARPQNQAQNPMARR